MKKLIFLSGKASSGKSTTLKILIAMLLNATPAHTVSVKHLYSRSRALYNNILNAWKNGARMPSGDISIVLEIDSVLVGVRTEGDMLGAVWAAIDYFEKKKCDIGVLACHPEHLTRSLPCMIAPWSCHKIVEKVPALNSSLYDQENIKAAQELFDIIMNDIKQIKNRQAKKCQTNNTATI